MPVEIKELVIRASVGAASGNADELDIRVEEDVTAAAAAAQAAIVQAAVREVLRILKTSKGR